MKRKSILVSFFILMIVVTVLAAPFGAAAQPVSRDSVQPPIANVSPDAKWLFHAITTPGGYLLAKSGVNNNTDKVTLPAGGKAIWIDANSGGAETRYETGNWYFDIFTDQDWGTNGSACKIDLGIWNGTTFTPFPSTLKSYAYLFFANYPAYDIRHMKYNSQALVVPQNSYLAVQIQNLFTEARPVFTYTDANKNGAFLQYTVISLPPPTTPPPTTTTPPTTTPPTTTPPTTTPPTTTPPTTTPPTTTPPTTTPPTTTPPTTTPTTPVTTTPTTTSPATTTPGGTVPAPVPVPGVTDLSGKINPNTGAFLTSVTAFSDDLRARLDIPAGTIGKRANGNPLSSITITRVDNPGGTRPAGANFRVGNLFYKFEPAGAKFSGPGMGMALITLPFDPTYGSDPFIAFWDTTAIPPGWNAINPPFTINADNTISGYTNHFTVYTVLFLATPTTTAAPTTINPVSTTTRTSPAMTTSTPAATLSSGATTGVTQGVTSTPAQTSNPVSSAGKGISNTVLIAVIVVAVLAVILIVVLVIRKRTHK